MLAFRWQPTLSGPDDGNHRLRAAASELLFTFVVGQTPTSIVFVFRQKDRTAADFLCYGCVLSYSKQIRNRTMKKVLIVDDSEPIRRRVAELLEESGQIRIVGQAGNSRDAMSAMQKLRPDTVILDIRIPESSGIQVLKEIKCRYPAVKVIMLTNFDNPQYRRQCRQLGADHFLNKTLEFEKIVASVTGGSTR